MIIQRHTRKMPHSLPEGRAPLRRPGADLPYLDAVSATDAMEHENQRLLAYEHQVKRAFDRIIPCVRKLAAIQYEEDFVPLAIVVCIGWQVGLTCRQRKRQHKRNKSAFYHRNYFTFSLKKGG